MKSLNTVIIQPQNCPSREKNYKLRVSKNGPFFMITLGTVDRFSHFFTVKFRKDLRRKVRLKLPPPLKSVTVALPSKNTSENNKLLSHEFLFVYSSFHPDTELRTTLQYFVCCITHFFQL